MDDFEVDLVRNDNDALIGRNLLAMAFARSRWITRRYVEIKFLDEKIVKYESRIDVRLGNLPRWRSETRYPLYGGRLALPILPLAKSTYCPYEVRDSTGALLPRLNQAEERRLVLTGLRSIVHEIWRNWGSPAMSAEVQRAIDGLTEQIVYGGQEKTVVEKLRELSKFGVTCRALEDRVLLGVFDDINSHNFLTVLVPHTAQNHVIEYSALRSATLESSRKKGIFVSGVVSLSVPVDTADDAGSIHITAFAPPDLEFEDTNVKGSRGEEVSSVKVAINTPHMVQVNILAPDRGASRPFFSSRLRHERRGLPTAGLLFVFLTAVILLLIGISAVFVGVDGLFVGPGSRVASPVVEPMHAQILAMILLLLPPPIAGFLVLPRRHGLTDRALQRIRILVMASGGVCVLPAIALAVNVSALFAAIVLLVCFVACVVIFCLLFVAYRKGSSGIAFDEMNPILSNQLSAESRRGAEHLEILLFGAELWFPRAEAIPLNQSLRQEVATVGVY